MWNMVGIQNMRMAAILRSAVSSARICNQEKKKSSKPLRYGTLALKCQSAAL